MIHNTLNAITTRIIQRSRETRQAYIARMQQAEQKGPSRTHLSCSNQAHGFAGCELHEKALMKANIKPNIAIVSAYNDILSAHKPYETFPGIIRQAAREAGAVAQFAGGVPAMCDGVTQGQVGMELSLFSRDVIALSTAVALSHHLFDGVLCLGICDKIVPGLVIGALSFGHLPVVFVPGGPMPSGLPNKEKNRIRQLFAEGKVGREALLEAEAGAYHSQGTCNFYGTANSNQMLMEIMGLQLPGSSFVHPHTPLREALTKAATRQAVSGALPLYRILDEQAVVNGIVGLLATGGSTNHTIHLIAMARAAGILIDWDDFSELSRVVPLLARIYPNGDKDVNFFHVAGGMGFLIRELLDAGLLHENVQTIAGKGLRRYCEEPYLEDGNAVWKIGAIQSLDKEVLRPAANPFQPQGGITLLQGNLGRAVIKTSAVKKEHLVIEAPARVFCTQDALVDAFTRGELEQDFIAVVMFQGPQANGMPELHQLTPPLGVLLDRGFKVALVTDGRMSGASGKVPAAIHTTPECLNGGMLAKVQDGDIIRLDAEKGTLDVLVDASVLAKRQPAAPDLSGNQSGTGRELFANMRRVVTSAEEGASFVVGGIQRDT